MSISSSKDLYFSIVVYLLLVLQNDAFTIPYSFKLLPPSRALLRQASSTILQIANTGAHSPNDANNDEVALWESRSSESPGDSNCFFQLGRALERRLIAASPSIRHDEMKKIVEAFESAANLERAAIVSHEGTSSANIVVVLRNLGMSYLRMGRQDDCMRTIDEQHRWISRKMPFAIENSGERSCPSAVADVEWIQSGTLANSRKVAFRTIGDFPLLDEDEIKIICNSLRRYRGELQPDRGATRFTMQYVGNTDYHVADMCVNLPELKFLIDHVLRTKVYPLVRKTFSTNSNDDDGIPETPLCVYDALIVRYDATLACQSGRTIKASLPLHRDGGLFSVNIALNSEFEKGGTFLDSLIDNEFGETLVQHPIAPGHAVAHRSTERHAGAPTQSGIREILVFFLTTRQLEGPAPKVEQAFYLKQMAQESHSMKLACYKLACKQNPNDAEAHFWAGFYLMKGDNLDFNAVSQAIEHLETSVRLCPNDARTFAYLGSIYSRRWAQFGTSCKLLTEGEEMEKTISVLKRAVYLEGVCTKVRCKEDMNIAAALLTLGQIFIYKKQYRQALHYLKNVEQKLNDLPDDVASSIRIDCNSLINDCLRDV